MGIIYKATNKINRKSYIGQTTLSLKTRKRQHFRAINDKYYFHNALKKYGQENFKWEIIEEAENYKLNEKEIYYIKKYNTFYNGYNSTSGGNSNFKVSDETRRKISESKKGRKLSNKHKKAIGKGVKGNKHSQKSKDKMSKAKEGIKRSNETKRKISRAHKGKKLSEETKRKIGNAMKGENNPFYGKKHTEEHKRKNQESHLGKKLSEETKRKISERSKGRKHSKKSIEKMQKIKSKIKWYVISPDGEGFYLYNLKQFCRENNLSFSALSSRGYTKGYSTKRMTEKLNNIENKQ